MAIFQCIQLLFHRASPYEMRKEAEGLLVGAMRSCGIESGELGMCQADRSQSIGDLPVETTF